MLQILQEVTPKFTVILFQLYVKDDAGENCICKIGHCFLPKSEKLKVGQFNSTLLHQRPRIDWFVTHLECRRHEETHIDSAKTFNQSWASPSYPRHMSVVDSVPYNAVLIPAVLKFSVHVCTAWAFPLALWAAPGGTFLTVSLGDSDQLPTWSHWCIGTSDYFKFKNID